MVAAVTLASTSDDSFEHFFVREYPRAVSIAMRVTGDAGEAEDVAQEVFVKCAQSRRYTKPGAGAWIHAATVHSALNAVRARTRRAKREAKVNEAVREHAPDPQTIVDRAHDRERARAALLRLSPNDAQLLALRYAGLSYRECADALALDVAQIGSRLARAERAFKKEIEREPS